MFDDALEARFSEDIWVGFGGEKISNDLGCENPGVACGKPCDFGTDVWVRGVSFQDSALVYLSLSSGVCDREPASS